MKSTTDFLKKNFIQINKRPHSKKTRQTNINKVFLRGRHTVPLYGSIRKRKGQEKKQQTKKLRKYEVMR